MQKLFVEYYWKVIGCSRALSCFEALKKFDYYEFLRCIFQGKWLVDNLIIVCQEKGEVGKNEH